MDTPVLALRFRDPGTVDTIREHSAIMGQEGAVWWGWWRKDTELFKEELLRALAPPFRVILVDRSTRRLFSSVVLKVRLRGDKDLDRSRIPRYYRDDEDQVAAWFLLSKGIAPAPYDSEVDDRFASSGNATLLDLRETRKTPNPGEAAGSRLALQRSTLLHLSDLHFGSDHAFLPPHGDPVIGDTRLTVTDAIFRDLCRLGRQNEIAAILVTGDFTTGGDWSDETRSSIIDALTSLLGALGLDRAQLIALPGNHDVVRYRNGAGPDPNKLAVENQKTYRHEQDFRLFVDELTQRNWRKPLNYLVRYALPAVDLDVVALNSCAIAATSWTEYGYVGVAGKDVLRDLAKSGCARPTYRIVALHHHLLPVNRIEAPSSKGVSLTLDAVALLEAAAEADVQLALHGHQHVARVANYERLPRLGDQRPGRISVVSGGSAGVLETRRGAERNTYSVIDLGPTGARLLLRELRADGMAASSIFDGPLPITPIGPVRLAH